MPGKIGLKGEVKDFWNEKSCGEVYATGKNEKDYYLSESRARYELEPYINDLARFDDGFGKDVLEIGVGMGTDHAEWAKAKPQSLTGIDLTSRAIEHTKKRFKAFGYNSNLKEADAEHLPFDDEVFDLVYSWGVLHHSPNTSQAICEVYRVLKPGGIARIMIYHKYSIVGYVLWLRYALLKGKIKRSLDDIYFNYLESPGTKAYTTDDAKRLFYQFSRIDVKVQLCLGDLMEGAVGQRHDGVLLTLAKRIWPRKIIKKLFSNHGLFLFIEAQK